MQTNIWLALTRVAQSHIIRYRMIWDCAVIVWLHKKGGMNMRAIVALMMLSILGFITAQSPAGAQTSETVKKINFITDFGFNGRHSYFYVALDKGYYKAEGLEVNIMRGNGSIDTVKKVASGTALIGFADLGALVLARGNDGIPVKVLAIMYGAPPHAIFALAGNGITTPKDLEGKTIADTAFSAIPLIFKTYAASQGIDASKVKWIAADTAALPSLLANGRVDAIGQFTVGQPLLEAAVKPKSLVRFAYKEAGLDYYGNGLVATDETIEKDPVTLKAFVRATLKGMRYAFARPQEAGDIIHRYQKQISPKVGEEETKLVKELSSIPGQKLGVPEYDGLQSTIDVMTQSYSVKDSLKPEDIYAPGFVE